MNKERNVRFCQSSDENREERKKIQKAKNDFSFRALHGKERTQKKITHKKTPAHGNEEFFRRRINSVVSTSEESYNSVSSLSMLGLILFCNTH